MVQPSILVYAPIAFVFSYYRLLPICSTWYKGFLLAANFDLVLTLPVRLGLKPWL